MLLAHERASAGGSDLVAKLKDEILRVISRHMQIDQDKVSVKMERGEQVSTLAVDVEIPFNAVQGSGQEEGCLRGCLRTISGAWGKDSVGAGYGAARNISKGARP